MWRLVWSPKTREVVMSYAFERDILKSRENCHKVNLLAKYPTVVPVKVTGNMISSHKDVPEGYSYLGCCDHRSENNDMHCPCSLYSTIEGMMFDQRSSRKPTGFSPWVRRAIFLA